MNIFDDLFNGKKSKFEETMDNLLDQTVDKVKELAKEPFTDKLTKTFNEADALMTESLEAIRDGREVPEEVQIPEGREMPDFEASEKSGTVCLMKSSTMNSADTSCVRNAAKWFRPKAITAETAAQSCLISQLPSRSVRNAAQETDHWR